MIKRMYKVLSCISTISLLLTIAALLIQKTLWRRRWRRRRSSYPYRHWWWRRRRRRRWRWRFWSSSITINRSFLSTLHNFINIINVLAFKFSHSWNLELIFPASAAKKVASFRDRPIRI